MVGTSLRSKYGGEISDADAVAAEARLCPAGLGGDLTMSAIDVTTLATRGESDRDARPTTSSPLSRHRSRLFVVPIVVLVDVLILGTLGGVLGYFTMALIAYGSEFLKGYDSVEAVLSLPMGWAASLLSLMAFFLFLKRRKERRTLSRSLFRSALVSVGSAFFVTFLLYFLLFLGLI
jgi:hypothetical protein